MSEDVGGCHGCTYMQWMYSDALVVVKCLPGVLDAGRCWDMSWMYVDAMDVFKCFYCC